MNSQIIFQNLPVNNFFCVSNSFRIVLKSFVVVLSQFSFGKFWMVKKVIFWESIFGLTLYSAFFRFLFKIECTGKPKINKNIPNYWKIKIAVNLTFLIERFYIFFDLLQKNLNSNYFVCNRNNN